MLTVWGQSQYESNLPTAKVVRAAVDDAAQDFQQLTNTVVSLRLVDHLPRVRMPCYAERSTMNTHTISGSRARPQA